MSFRPFAYALVLSVVLACGGSNNDSGAEDPSITDLKNKVRQISDTTGSLAALIASDYATCPNSGDTSDALIRKICNVAQAATNEARVEMKGQLAVFAQMLQTQIDAVNNNVANLNSTVSGFTSQIASINSQIATINGTLTSLDTRVTSAEAAIVALQALTASITGTLAGNLITLDIGSDNSSAGPLYETVLRRNDRKRFNGYVEALGSPWSLPNAPVTTTNGSANVTVAAQQSAAVTISNASPAIVTYNAHGLTAGRPIRLSTLGTLPAPLSPNTIYYVVNPTANNFQLSLTVGGAAINTSSAGSGLHNAALSDILTNDRVRLTDLAEGNGITSGDLAREYIVVSTSCTAATCATGLFTLTLTRTATANGTIGGNAGVAQKIIGRGMATLWKSQDPSDTAVRVSNLGSKRYNFIIRRRASDVSNDTAELCYDKTAVTGPTATFATINAAPEGGNASITCL